MPNAPIEPMHVCTHERGPSTTVCLHCRREIREAARVKRRKVMLRGAAIGIVLVVIVAGGALSASAIRDHVSTHGRSSEAGRVADPTTDGVIHVAALDAHSAPSPRGARTSAASNSASPFAPIIPAGETTIRQGVVASRTPDGVLVSFDAPMLRTRMPVKFEAFVRATLPALYGAGADSALAKLPDGGIARQGDLINELPLRGVRIPASGGWTFVVYPETRPGQDGPLVIRYHVQLLKN